MGGAVVRKRPDGVECVSKHGPLIENSRIPETGGVAWSARGAAVTARAPSPFHRVTWVNRDR